MLVLELAYPQVTFHLVVRKADLEVISMKQLDILMTAMVTKLKTTISKDYLVIAQVTLDGVMTSTST